MSHLPLYRIDHILEAFAKVNPTLRVGQMRVLLYVARFNGATVYDFADKIDIEQHTAYRYLTEWVSKGMLELQPGAGRIANSYYLTPVGQSFINSLTEEGVGNGVPER